MRETRNAALQLFERLSMLTGGGQRLAASEDVLDGGLFGPSFHCGFGLGQQPFKLFFTAEPGQGGTQQSRCLRGIGLDERAGSVQGFRDCRAALCLAEIGVDLGR
jgi:hypothetical protein